MKKPVVITKVIADVRDELDGKSIDDVIIILTKYRDDNTDDYSDIRLDIDYYHDYGDSISLQVEIKGDRSETLEERLERESKDRRYNELKEANERRILEALTAKYK